MPSPESASWEVLVGTQAVGVNFADIISALVAIPDATPLRSFPDASIAANSMA